MAYHTQIDTASSGAVSDSKALNKSSVIMLVVGIFGVFLLLSILANIFQFIQAQKSQTDNHNNALVQTEITPVVNNEVIDSSKVTKIWLSNIGTIYFIPVDNTELRIKYLIPGVMIQNQGAAETQVYNYTGKHYPPATDVDNDMIRFMIFDTKFDPSSDEFKSLYSDTQTNYTINDKVFSVYLSNTDQEVQSCGKVYTTTNSEGKRVSFSLCFERRFIQDGDACFTSDSEELAKMEKTDYKTIADIILKSIKVY